MMHEYTLLRAELIRSLCRSGGKYYDVKRVPKDPNGQPTGEAKTIGRMIGIGYTARNDAVQLTIDLPGVVGRGKRPAVAGALLCGEEPEEGDVIAAGGKETRVLSVSRSGFAYTLYTEEVI